jgi:hypothetical protein
MQSYLSSISSPPTTPAEYVHLSPPPPQRSYHMGFLCPPCLEPSGLIPNPTVMELQ